MTNLNMIKINNKAHKFNKLLVYNTYFKILQTSIELEYFHVVTTNSIKTI